MGGSAAPVPAPPPRPAKRISRPGRITENWPEYLLCGGEVGWRDEGWGGGGESRPGPYTSFRIRINVKEKCITDAGWPPGAP